MGKTQAFRLSARDGYFNQLDSLKIELASLFGDADLQVSINGQVFYSNSQL
jgi:hypothetical protein